MSKQCSNCLVYKDIDTEFSMGNKYKKSVCKPCHAKYMRDYREKNKSDIAIRKQAKNMSDEKFDELCQNVQKIGYLLDKKVLISLE